MRPSLKPILFATALAGAASPALAVDTSMQLVLELEGNAQRDVITYQCEDRDEPLTVSYINAHPIFLALVPVDDGEGDVEDLIFVNVISGSGARYASGQYVWWTQGNEGALYDEMSDEEDTPILDCIAANDIP